MTMMDKEFGNGPVCTNQSTSHIQPLTFSVFSQPQIINHKMNVYSIFQLFDEILKPGIHSVPFLKYGFRVA